MPIYCGNKLNHPDLLSGVRVLGTNYDCLRKGIGVGSHLPYDADYAGVHIPVDTRKYYCGLAPAPPPGGGYFAVGSPFKCLQIGVGVGKAQRASMGPPAFMYFIRYILPYLLFLLIIGIVFAFVYFFKPKILTKEEKDGKKFIYWSKFIPIYIIICLISAILIWYFWKRFIRMWI